MISSQTQTYDEDPRDVEIQRLNDKLEDLRGEKERLDQLLHDILDSRSWRLTKPLRAAIALKRRVWPLFRFRRCRATLVSGTSATVSADGVVEVHGQSAKIGIDFSDSAPPQGWVCLEGRLSQSDKGHQFFYLYEHGSRGDFTANLRHEVSFESADSLTKIVIHLQPQVSALRLDPFEEQARFKLEGLIFRELGSLQLVGHILARHLRGVCRNPRLFFSKARTLFALLREGGLMAVRSKLFAHNVGNNYQDWVRRYDTLSPEDLVRLHQVVATFVFQPKISVIMPVFNTPQDYLERAIASVEAQVYPHWELCIADDCSSMPEVRRVLEAAVKRGGGKIKVTYRSEQGHIAAASASALGLASGEFLALLDHDDELTPHALALLVASLQEHRDANLILFRRR